MDKTLYLVKCLTNLHVGSGEANYNVVDKEVEKDPITGYPIIHASGVKGALRSCYHETNKDNTEGEQNEKSIFGEAGDNASDKTAAFRFLNAEFLCRPLRVRGEMPSIPVTTVAAINALADLAEAFAIPIGLCRINSLSFGNNKFLATRQKISVEGEPTGQITGIPDDQMKILKDFLGEDFAVAKSLQDYELPVIARNNLQPGRENLWYEEYVPHGSRFVMLVFRQSGNYELDEVIPSIVQIGGNASIGYGYCAMERKWPHE